MMLFLLVLSFVGTAERARSSQGSDSDVCLLALSQSRSIQESPANGRATILGGPDGSADVQLLRGRRVQNGKGSPRNDQAAPAIGTRRPRGTCGVLWFVHIPRTAGSSYKEYLQNKFDKQQLHALWEFGSMEKPTTPVLFETELKPKMDDLVADPRGRLVAVHHRHGAPGMHALLPVLEEYRARLTEKGCHLFLTTVVRSPDGWMESMLTSTSRELAAPAQEEEWRRLLSTDEYDNGEIRYLLNNAPTVPEAYPLPQGVDDAAMNRVGQILDAFDIVGFTETFDTFVRKVDSMVHFAHSRVPHMKRTPMLEATALHKMPVDITARAHERTASDWALYRDLRERAAQNSRRQLSLFHTAPATKFCFMVIRPNTYEEELLRAAMKDGGFPGCTEFRVYSNVSVVGGQPAIPAVIGSMDVPICHMYNSALNTPIFLQVYRKMFQDGDYRNYDWVLKIDADSFVNDAILQRVLDREPNVSAPVVLNNAEHDGPLGLKGALIAVTSAALSLYAENQEACEGGVAWNDKSEDYYLGICLIEVLKVPVRFEPQLVKQLGTAGPKLCSDKAHAVFHPLKSSDEFESCKKRVEESPELSLYAEWNPAAGKFRGQMPSIVGVVGAFFGQPGDWAAESLEGISQFFSKSLR